MSRFPYVRIVSLICRVQIQTIVIHTIAHYMPGAKTCEENFTIRKKVGYFLDNS